MIPFRSSLLFLLMFVFTRSLAQTEYQINDYVITVRGDTLTGKVKMLSFDLGANDKVELATKGKKTIYTAKQVRTIHISKETYNSIMYTGSYQFMKPLKLGYLSLYAFREANKATYDGRFLVKRDGASLEVPNLLFKKAMRNFLKDCPGLTDQLNNGDLGKPQLDRIIDQYNTCIEYNTKKILKEPKDFGQKVNPSSATLETLKKKVEDLPDFPNKKDALDLLADMDDKLRHFQPVPDYLIHTLEGYIGTNDLVKKDLQDFVGELKKK